MSTRTEVPSLEAKIDDLASVVGDMHAALIAEQRRRSRLEELVGDAMPMLETASDRAAERLDVLDRRGYFAFAKAGAEVLDEVVSHFGEDGVRQLGEHIVTILEALKEMTQPDMLGLVHHAVDAVARQRVAVESEHEEPPTFRQLARQARQPAVRRGLGRTLGTLAAMASGPDDEDLTTNTTRR